MSGETPKKVTSAEGDCFLCKDKIPSLKEKVKIFGKSELQIGALIHRSLGVDWVFMSAARTSRYVACVITC